MPTQGLPSFVLYQDNWNDFHFSTQYHLYFADGKTEPNLIGTVKILKQGQTKNDGLQIVEDFQSLSDSFCSVGQSLDYYERLALLGEELRDQALSSLQDFVQQPKLAEKFRNESGWTTSLFRDFRENDEFINLARLLLSQNYTSMPAKELSFSFQMTGWEQPLKFDFTSPEIPDDFGLSLKKILPSRISVIIGRNASGKSTVLARLARVTHAPQKERHKKLLRSLGEIKPKGIGFSRILTVSYSAFDSFRLPVVGKNEVMQNLSNLQKQIIGDEREQIIKEVSKGEGRFVFCGLRDIAGEMQAELETVTQNVDDSSSELPSHFSYDRQHKTLLKSIDVLAEEFERTLNVIKASKKTDVFDGALDILISDSSFSDYEEELTLKYLLSNDSKAMFLSWSTGHKIVMHIIANVVGYSLPRSLLLIDEPETHLHPPLLATLMHAIRYILDEVQAFAIVATHSPVVVQETLSKHVQVVNRIGFTTDVKSTKIETFGENIGAITDEVFRLNSEVTDYHKILRKIVKRCETLEDIEILFGEHGLSMQARAYVMSLLASKKVEA